MGLWSFYGDVLPFTVMAIVECTSVGSRTIYKAAMLKGMNHFVFLVYNHALATLILLPSSFIFHRSTIRPPLTFSILCRIFLLSLIGCLMQNLSYTGINYSSPTLASVLSNLVPAFTFLLAIIFRMEKLELRSSRSQAKSIGTIVSISGAFIMTLCKGPPILMIPSPSNSSHQLLHSPQSNWITGSLFLTATYILTPIWYIFQASIVKEYPAEVIIVFFYSCFLTIQAIILSLIAETDPHAWIVRPDMELVSIIYSGVFMSLLNTIIHTWILGLKGPVYVAMFHPLSIVIAVVMGAMFLGDTLYLGSVVGAIIISLGFYAVMWGKAKEEKMCEDCGGRSLESARKVPLLHNNEKEVLEEEM